LEKVTYFDLPNCYKLSNATVEVIVTTDVGPRILRYGFIGEENIFGAVPETTIETELGAWKPWGGHRLWTAPEMMPRSYAPDNDPIEYKFDGDGSIHLIQSAEQQTSTQKEIKVSLDAHGTSVRVEHKISNRNLWAIDVAPWALTIMNAGGEVILPQEPYRKWEEALQPARPMVLWHYTDLSDPRWTIGQKYIRLRTDASRTGPQKLGILNKQEWAAYHLHNNLFIKRFAYHADAVYPDYGSNTEVYTAGSFIELESLAPIKHLEPGAAVTHIEHWQLFKNIAIGVTEASISAAIDPLFTNEGSHG
jgi:hypothetical protein